jgi:hypothetical protein
MILRSIKHNIQVQITDLYTIVVSIKKYGKKFQTPYPALVFSEFSPLLFSRPPSLLSTRLNN